jgi:hypothetical protein
MGIDAPRSGGTGAARHRCVALCTNARAHFRSSFEPSDTGGLPCPAVWKAIEIWIVRLGSLDIPIMVSASRGVNDERPSLSRAFRASSYEQYE